MYALWLRQSGESETEWGFQHLIAFVLLTLILTPNRTPDQTQRLNNRVASIKSKVKGVDMDFIVYAFMLKHNKRLQCNAQRF